jgi:spermidine/putrescine transport system substrate-binding protein/spermidine/putrescine transport system permease protein
MLEKLDLSDIDNIKNIDPQYLKMYFDPGNEYSVPYMISNAILCYNKQKIPEGITSFNDIFDPKYKNSIVSLDDQRMVIGLAAIAAGESVNETDPAKLEKIKEKLFSLKPNIKVFDSDSPKSSMISGETSIGYVWCAEASLAMKENKDIVPVYPEEGLCLMFDNFVIPSGAENKKNAELFINFFLRPEISKMFSDEFPYVNPNKAALPLMSEEYKSNPASNPPAGAIAKGQLLKDLGDSTGLYDDIWTEFKNK